MGKQRRKVRPEEPRPESYDRIAERLVYRGLASPLILDKPRRGRPSLDYGEPPKRADARVASQTAVMVAGAGHDLQP